MKNRDYRQSPLKVSVRKSETFKNPDEISEKGKHKLATIMFSDICGFTKMMGNDESRTMQIVEQNKSLHQKFINKNSGKLIKELGDGLMVSFESTHDAVRCAKEIIEEVNSAGSYQLHIGIHLGDIIFTHEDIFGDGVNIAARLNACARESEIIISDEVWKNIKNQKEFGTEYLGKRTLKNVDHPLKVHRVLLDDEKRKMQFKAVFYTHSKTIKTVVTGIIIASLLLSIYYFTSLSNSYFRDDNQTIAVLPFENRSDLEDFDYLREGLAEDVISQLFNFSSLSVISSRSTFRFKDTDKSIKQISRELKADIVLIGSYAIDNRDINVKVEVINGQDSEILNYASLTGDLDHIRDISSQVGDNISNALKITNGNINENQNTRLNDVNIEAYKYNALGKSAMRDHTGQKLEDITQYFLAAIELDSEYVDPYIGMAEAFIFDVNRGYISPAECAQKAKKYALKAEKLNPGSGEVSGIMGIIYYLDFDFKKAVPYFEKSLEKSPNFSLTYLYYSLVLEVLGDFDKAEELQKQLGILDPLNLLNDVYLALNYIFQDELIKADEVIESNLSLHPGHAELLWIKSVILIEKGLYNEAYETLLNRNFGLETNFVAGYVFAKVGQEERAKAVLDNILDASKKHYVPPSQIALVMCGLKQYDQALEKVEEAFLVHDIWIGWVEYTSMADPIKNNPRYVSLMTKLGWR